MHLKYLEDYVVELASRNLDNTGEFISTGDVVSRLMEIIVIEERLIPDFVVDGDSLNTFEDDFFNIDKDPDSLSVEQIDGGAMKLLAWIGSTIIIGAICFLIGFFVAPA